MTIPSDLGGAGGNIPSHAFGSGICNYFLGGGGKEGEGGKGTQKLIHGIFLQYLSICYILDGRCGSFIC